ncbi:hypothetical protein C8R47DRAFT_1218175 [Mycena vitilis]|nr:hypothetical protein C8R47DRAFT_1218175 [Mycena vitilis]
MPIETPIDPATISTKGERVQMIHQLRELLSELHTKQIVNGDLKPHNLLMCSDGRIRLCDFDNASIEDDGFVSVDLDAGGGYMWHLYTGEVPLTYDDDSKDQMKRQGKRMNRAFAGFLPDMKLVDDPDIASLIETCLAAGPDRPDIWDSGQPTFCITTHFVFGLCEAEPRHTYSRTIHATDCLYRYASNRDGGPCECPFVDPKVFTAQLEPICTRCNIGVDYHGLTI